MINYRQALLYLGFEDQDFILQNDNDERGTFIGVWLSESPQPTKAEIETAHAEWEAEWNAKEYARLRKAEYDQLNQFEMMFDDQANGTTTWVDAINAIKARHPKP